MLGTWLRFAFISSLLYLTAVALPAQQFGSQQEDPIAEAARKAREQKKAAPKPKKVYTDDDMPKAPRASEQPPATGTAAAQGQPAAQGEAGPTKPDKEPTETPEQVWRGRFKAQHDKIARAEKELDILQREDQKAQVQYYSDPQKALSEQNSRKDINEKNVKIEAKKKEIDALRQGLADLEDQLRKAGGDSGWSRP